LINLKDGWLICEPDEFILKPAGRCAHRIERIVLHTKIHPSGDDSQYNELVIPQGSTALILPGAKVRIIPREVEFIAVSYPTSLLKAVSQLEEEAGQSTSAVKGEEKDIDQGDTANLSPRRLAKLKNEED
jgi:hypothetical protein